MLTPPPIERPHPPTGSDASGPRAIVEPRSGDGVGDRGGRFKAVSAFLVSITAHTALLLVLALLLRAHQRASPIVMVISTQEFESGGQLVVFSDDPVVEPDPAADASESMVMVPLLLLDEPIEAEITPPDLGVAHSGSPAQAANDPAPQRTDKQSDSKPSVTFFGTHAYGDKFVYVLDVSGSMAAGNGRRMHRARNELIRSINSLQPHHSFYVVLYSGYAVGMYGDWNLPRLAPATIENKKRVARWVSQIRPSGGTMPAGALKMAGGLVPDAVFFLSDGEFIYDTPDAMAMDQFLRSFRQARPDWRQGIAKPVRESPKDVLEAYSPETLVHTIAFESHASRLMMERIAKEKGGQFRFVPPPEPVQVPRRAGR